MRSLIKIIVILTAVVLAFISCVFVYGMYLGATGQMEVDPDPSPSTEAQGEVEPVGSAPAPASAPDQELELPQPLDAQSASDWLLSSGFFSLDKQADQVVADLDQIATMPVDAAVQIYQALRDGGDDHQTMRLFFFGWMGLLDQNKRREFAEQAGAVHRPKGVSATRAYRGDLLGIFYLQTDDQDSVYAQAVRGYASVTESESMLAVLRDFGVITEDVQSGNWTLRVEQKMDSFDALTLLAIHDSIKKDLFGNRTNLRDQLAELADTKR